MKANMTFLNTRIDELHFLIVKQTFLENNIYENKTRIEKLTEEMSRLSKKLIDIKYSTPVAPNLLNSKNDEVEKDEVEKDEEEKDEEEKDEEEKDEVETDEVEKDEVEKDEEEKDEVEKDEVEKDEVEKDEVVKQQVPDILKNLKYKVLKKS
jgi:cobalamin biosynthesis protein CobT